MNTFSSVGNSSGKDAPRYFLLSASRLRFLKLFGWFLAVYFSFCFPASAEIVLYRANLSNPTRTDYISFDSSSLGFNCFRWDSLANNTLNESYTSSLGGCLQKFSDSSAFRIVSNESRFFESVFLLIWPEIVGFSLFALLLVGFSFFVLQ